MALNSIVGAYGIGTYETSEFKYETVNVRQKMLNGVSVVQRMSDYRSIDFRRCRLSAEIFRPPKCKI